MLRWQRLAAAALIATVVLAAYWPAVHVGFLWDDDTLLTENELVKAPDGLKRIRFTTEPLDYWPITNTSFWVEWRLWGMGSDGLSRHESRPAHRERAAPVVDPAPAVDPGRLRCGAAVRGPPRQCRIDRLDRAAQERPVDACTPAPKRCTARRSTEIHRAG
jgi:hypothetical protein